MTLGKTYYPKPKKAKDNEVIGDHWSVWQEGDGYFYSFDAGHFSTEMVTQAITKDEFESIKSGSLTEPELNRRYR